MHPFCHSDGLKVRMALTNEIPSGFPEHGDYHSHLKCPKNARKVQLNNFDFFEGYYKWRHPETRNHSKFQPVWHSKGITYPCMNPYVGMLWVTYSVLTGIKKVR